MTHEQTLPSELKYQVAAGRLQLTTRDTGKPGRTDKAEGVPQNVTRHYQPPWGLEKAAKEAREHHGCNLVSSDSVRNPELSCVKLQREGENSS